MNKLKTLGLLATVMVGTFALVGCGGEGGGGKDEAGKVGDKFMNSMYKDATTSKEDIKSLVGSKVSEKDINDMADSYSISGILNSVFSESDKKEMKEVGVDVDKSITDLTNTIAKKIKIERTELVEEEGVVEAKYKVSIPMPDDAKIEDEVTKLLDTAQKDIKDGKLKVEEGIKKAYDEMIKLYVSEYSNTEKFEDLNLTLELEKEKGKWVIVNTK